LNYQLISGCQKIPTEKKSGINRNASVHIDNLVDARGITKLSGKAAQAAQPDR